MAEELKEEGRSLLDKLDIFKKKSAKGVDKVKTGYSAVEDKLLFVSVQVQKGHVRSRPSFLGEIVATLSYGDRIRVRGKQGSWTKVRLPEGEGEGWMHKSALTRKKIILDPEAADVEEAATSDELALAGKGFNEHVEARFKGKHQDLDYIIIDRMEQIIVSQEQISGFLKEGELTPKKERLSGPEGGAP
ncbi:MAG: SH3 domain-containing protein [Deltaproteobacteria bacterium]|nr:SH3 domain-containing protein [Deltaproteobacteria bacterium]